MVPVTPREAFDHISDDAKGQAKEMIKRIDAYLLKNYDGEEKMVYKTDWEISRIFSGAIDIVRRVFERVGWRICTIQKKKGPVTIEFYNRELEGMRRLHLDITSYVIISDEILDAAIEEILPEGLPNEIERPAKKVTKNSKTKALKKREKQSKW